MILAPSGRRAPAFGVAPYGREDSEDDHVDGINQSLVYYIALKNAGVPVEMHSYAHGRHRLGYDAQRFPLPGWPRLVQTWLRTLGVLPHSTAFWTSRPPSRA
jgi:hypothetical protein